MDVWVRSTDASNQLPPSDNIGTGPGFEEPFPSIPAGVICTFHLLITLLSDFKNAEPAQVRSHVHHRQPSKIPPVT